MGCLGGWVFVVPPGMRERDCYRGNRHGYGAGRAPSRSGTEPVGHRAGRAPSRSGTKLVGQACRARMGRRAVSEGAGRDLVERARSAAARGGWEQAFDLLVEADGDGLLAPAELPV